MGRGLIYLSLGLILAIASFAAWTMWFSIDTPMPAFGWGALIAGIVFSLALGAVLMGITFWSARRGYDDRASGTRDTVDDRDA